MQNRRTSPETRIRLGIALAPPGKKFDAQCGLFQQKEIEFPDKLSVMPDNRSEIRIAISNYIEEEGNRRRHSNTGVETEGIITTIRGEKVPPAYWNEDFRKDAEKNFTAVFESERLAEKVAFLRWRIGYHAAWLKNSIIGSRPQHDSSKEILRILSQDKTFAELVRIQEEHRAELENSGPGRREGIEKNTLKKFQLLRINPESLTGKALGIRQLGGDLMKEAIGESKAKNAPDKVSLEAAKFAGAPEEILADERASSKFGQVQRAVKNQRKLGVKLEYLAKMHERLAMGDLPGFVDYCEHELVPKMDLGQAAKAIFRESGIYELMIHLKENQPKKGKSAYEILSDPEMLEFVAHGIRILPGLVEHDLKEKAEKRLYH
ncbi:Uncharacterised protein [uncultured archaeon]|nr:Uncharacterised protein [uncultured archaeon]